jgi:hypothetical protein
MKIDVISNHVNIMQLEEKERKEETKSKQNEKKPPSRFYKGEDTRRIIPVIDIELKKKIERADTVSKDKKEGVKKIRVRLIYIIYLRTYFVVL